MYYAGSDDPNHASFQSHDAVRLGPHTPASTKHKQSVHTGGAAEATTTAATNTADQHG